MEGLNNKIWQKDGNIIPEVRKKLLEVAKRFLSDFITPVKVRNIYFVGSLASYQWTPTSDVDIHITVDVQEEYSSQSTSDYFQLKADLFNKTHNIFIKGYKVEINIKPEEIELTEFYKNKPIYDIFNEQWVKLPNPNVRRLDDPLVLKISKYFEDKINSLINTQAPSQDYLKLKNTIKAFRKQGLKHDGEYSVGNLVFKKLRNSGANEKLFDFKNDIEDKELSLEKFKNFFKK
jgi:predicted nucleotidyltransferase